MVSIVLKEWVTCTFKCSRPVEGVGNVESHARRCSPWLCCCVDLQTGCCLSVFCLSVPRKMNTHGQFCYPANTVSVDRNNFVCFLLTNNKKRYIPNMNQGLIFIQSMKHLDDSCKWEVCIIWSEIYAYSTQTKIKLVHQLHMGLRTKFHWHWCDSVRGEVCMHFSSTYVPLMFWRYECRSGYCEMCWLFTKFVPLLSGYRHWARCSPILRNIFINTLLYLYLNSCMLFILIYWGFVHSPGRAVVCGLQHLHLNHIVSL